MQLGLSTTTMICLLQARSSTHWMFGWQQKRKTHPLSNADKNICCYLVNKQKLFLSCCYKDWNSINHNTLCCITYVWPPQTPMGFWSRPVEVRTNIEVEALLVSGRRRLLASYIRHWYSDHCTGGRWKVSFSATACVLFRRLYRLTDSCVWMIPFETGLMVVVRGITVSQLILLVKKGSHSACTELTWPELTCNNSTQLHDAFIGRARQRHDLIGCSETGAGVARRVLNTCVPP